MSQYVTFTNQNARIQVFVSPWAAGRSLLRQSPLIRRLAYRDLTQRYRSSFLGNAWTVLVPFFYLALYTFVFNVVLKAHWGEGEQSGTAEFALALFCGLTLFNIFSESVLQAPGLVVTNVTYVKKIFFPLEILPLVTLLQVLVKAAASLVILALGILLVHHRLPWTFCLLPLPFLPMILYTLGVMWFLAALGVFVRDVDQAAQFPVQLVFFMTPIVYPMSSIPQRFHVFLQVNPFVSLVEMMRDVALWGRVPDLRWYGANLLLSLIVFQLGYIFFMKCKRGFADVL